MKNNFLSQFEDYKIPLHGVRLPSFLIDAKYKSAVGLGADANNDSFLRTMCFKKLGELNLLANEEYVQRLNYEHTIISELGFTDYILLCWDITNFCNENGIPTGAGRGSAAGSLTLYLIGVTKIDPIKYGLFFERFISKARAKKHVVDGITYLDGALMCDVDMDICFHNRGRVLRYLEERFVGRTCKILTTTTLQGKLLIKECGKIVDGLSEDEMKAVVNLIPELFGKVRDIELCYDGKKDGEKVIYEVVEEFKDWCDQHPDSYKIALKLRNLIKNKSAHASAMLLSYDTLEESIPVELSSHKELVSSWTMDWATITNVKLDLLGLRSVSVVDEACKLIGDGITPDSIDLNDPFIYQNLQELKTPHGLFQLEADTVFRVIRKIKPKNLEELSGVIAIARPGAMQFIDEYASYTNTGTIQSVHPFFDDVLGNTGGLCLYQEQLLKMVHKIGFTLDEAEIIRRVIGKKKVKEMAEWEQKVKDKIKEQNLDPAIADELWKIMDASKDYSFNKCLSPDTVVETENGFKIMAEISIGEKIKAYDTQKKIDHFVTVKNKFENQVEMFEVEIEDGRIIQCSMNHKFLCSDGLMHPMEEICSKNLLIMCND